MTLYEINEEILNCVDMETGEIIDADRLDALEIERDKKLESIALWIKNLKSDIKALKEEEENLKARRYSKECKMESLEKYLSNMLEGAKFENERVKVSFRKTQSVIIDNLEDLNEDYLRFKTTCEADKKAISEAIKNGQAVAGAHIEEKLSMSVK